jgi:hypothetical protein
VTNQRISELLAYFDRLLKAEELGFNCPREINEVIDAIRFEFFSGRDINRE